MLDLTKHERTVLGAVVEYGPHVAAQVLEIPEKAINALIEEARSRHALELNRFLFIFKMERAGYTWPPPTIQSPRQAPRIDPDTRPTRILTEVTPGRSPIHHAGAAPATRLPPAPWEKSSRSATPQIQPAAPPARAARPPEPIKETPMSEKQTQPPAGNGHFTFSDVEHNVAAPPSRPARGESRYSQATAAIFNAPSEHWHRMKVADPKAADKLRSHIVKHARETHRKISIRVASNGQDLTFFYWNWTPVEETAETAQGSEK